MERDFQYPSRTEKIGALSLGLAVAGVALLLIWLCTDWLGGGDPMRGIGLCTFAAGAFFFSALAGADWFFPVMRRCWIRDEAFGWDNPRPRSSGSVRLEDVRTLRDCDDHFEVVTRHDELRVPRDCVQELDEIAAWIVAQAPHIALLPPSGSMASFAPPGLSIPSAACIAQDLTATTAPAEAEPPSPPRPRHATPVQCDQIRAQQRLGLGVLVLSMIPFSAVALLANRFFDGFGTALEIVLFLLPAGSFLLILFWRCPVCRHFFSRGSSGKYCSRCDTIFDS